MALAKHELYFFPIAQAGAALNYNNLFGTSRILEQAIHTEPRVGRYAAADRRKSVSLLRTIDAPPLIPSHFSANGGGVGTNQVSNLLIRMPRFQ
ncbi:MAG: hypothetical protein AB7P17_10070 [Nitrospirales bacterium]|nr:hypothetical protein [Nitrospirales bacterium]